MQINPSWRPEQVDAIDEWIGQQPDPKPERVEAVRILTMRALTAGL